MKTIQANIRLSKAQAEADRLVDEIGGIGETNFENVDEKILLYERLKKVRSRITKLSQENQ